MKLHVLGSMFFGSFAIVALSTSAPLTVLGQSTKAKAAVTHPSAILVELFTSEGCSDCPPADDLLRQVSGRRTPEGQLIVGISEHVSYWNSLGWKDPFSSDLNTERQNAYSNHFGLDSIYTPQMVVNGREQFVGSDRRAFENALKAESGRSQVTLQINSATVVDRSITFSYSASDLGNEGTLQLVAALVDDMDESNVLRGENSGRKLTHVAVARVLTPLGALREVKNHSITLPVPPSFLSNPGSGHHLVLFAQRSGPGAVMAVDTTPI